MLGEEGNTSGHGRARKALSLYRDADFEYTYTRMKRAGRRLWAASRQTLLPGSGLLREEDHYTEAENHGFGGDTSSG